MKLLNLAKRSLANTLKGALTIKSTGGLIFIFIISYLPTMAYASSAGQLSDTIIELLGDVSDIITVIAFVTGGAFAVSAIMKFNEHRRSPQHTPISRPITEIIVAIILIALPFILAATTDNALFSG